MIDDIDDPHDAGPSAVQRKRVHRALAEIHDHVSEPLPERRLWTLLGLAMDTGERRRSAGGSTSSTRRRCGA